MDVRREDWLDRLFDWRNTLISNEKFQRIASAFPLVRHVARRRAQRAFDLTAGFVYSQILYACVELKILDMLRERPLSLSRIATETGLSLDAAARLLSAAAALDLVERRRSDVAIDPRYGLGMQGAALLGNRGALAMIEHHRMFYADLADPVALLRGEVGQTRLSRYWAYATAKTPGGLEPAETEDYSALMAASQPLVSADILAAFSFSSYRTLLDIGGGEGAFLQAAAAANPQLKLMLFDLPSVVGRARDRFDEAGLTARANCHGGDFKRDALPLGADAVSLIRVAHDHDDATLRLLLRKVRAALPHGGTLIIGEPMSDPDARTVGDAYFGFYLLAMGCGRPRSAARLSALLREAGFDTIRIVKTRRPMLTGLVTARAAAPQNTGVL